MLLTEEQDLDGDAFDKNTVILLTVAGIFCIPKSIFKVLRTAKRGTSWVPVSRHLPENLSLHIFFLKLLM